MIHCACGRAHASAEQLVKVGWQDLCSGGEFALLVNCPCGSTIVAEVRSDAALCVGCRRLVTGEAGDSIVHDPDLGAHCRRCATRRGVGDPAVVALSFRDWVKTGDRRALHAFRLAFGARARAA